MASSDEEQAALDVLKQLVRDDPEVAEEIVLVRFDELGAPVVEPVRRPSVRPRQPK